MRETLPEIAAAAMLQPETRPRAEPHDDGLILNLRGVNLNPGQASDDMVSLRLWITARTVISARMRRIFAIDDLRSQLHEGANLSGPAEFLFRLATSLTDRIETVSLALEEETDELEEQIYDRQHDDAPALLPYRRKAIRLRRFVGPQREALARLAAFEGGPLPARDRARLREIANRTARIVEELDATRDRLTAIQDHLDTRQGVRIARHSHILSIVAAIFLPLSFLTGLFGANLGGIPGATAPLAFWALAAGLIALGAALLLIFRHLKWF